MAAPPVVGLGNPGTAAGANATPSPSASSSTATVLRAAAGHGRSFSPDQLDGASRMLSGLGALNARQAERVAARMDRLASQLLEVSAPAPMAAVHERLGTTPARAEEFASLVGEMSPADGEG